jgi:SAM-dependent methyltransferase
MPAADVMAQYVDQEYADGAYQDYVRARDLKLLTFRSRARQILARSGHGRLLDVGAACGYFVEAALEVGFDAYGLEISPVAIAQAADDVRPRMLQGDVNHLAAQQGQTYDVVTAFDIVEHVFDPLAFLESLTPLIRPGGLLVMSTPDTGHALRYLMGRSWPMLQPLQHTVLFSRGSLADALRQVGFTDVKIVPARKVLTADYLAGQVGTLSPAIGHAYELGSKVVPAFIRTKPVGVNIGELMSFAAWPGQ